jgi:hypothetical protein
VGARQRTDALVEAFNEMPNVGCRCCALRDEASDQVQDIANTMVEFGDQNFLALLSRDAALLGVTKLPCELPSFTLARANASNKVAKTHCGVSPARKAMILVPARRGWARILANFKVEEIYSSL